MSIEDYLKSTIAIGTVEIKEETLVKICTRLREWESIALTYESKVKGLEDLVASQKLEIDSRNSRLIDLEV